MFPGDGATPDALLTVADQAMYTAKANGVGYCLVSALGVQDDLDQPDGYDQTGEPPADEPVAPVSVLPPEPAQSIVREMRGPPSAAAEKSRGASAAPPPAAAIGHRNENRRGERRNRVYKRGRIIFGDGFSTIDCTIRDLSAHGARISVEDQVTIPPRFSFAILDTGEVYPAVRRWQRGRGIGLEFVIEAHDAGTAGVTIVGRLVRPVD